MIIDWHHVYSLMYKSKMRGIDGLEMKICEAAFKADPERYRVLKAKADREAFFTVNPMAGSYPGDEEE